MLIVSEHILTELARTFEDRYFAHKLSPDQIEAALTSLRVRAALQAITVDVRGVATQPKDDLVLATAVSAGAQYLVTGDGRLQQLGRFQDVTILSPRQFLTVLETDGG